MSGHTPGPWMVEPLVGKYYGTEVIAANGEDGHLLSICRVWRHDGYDAFDISGRQAEAWHRSDYTDAEWSEFLKDYIYDTHHELEHDYADACLIAAAPELLAALDTMTERYVSLANSGDCGNWNPEEEAEVKAARAAIAKATNQPS